MRVAGIDFGTTNSTAGYLDEADTPVMLPLGEAGDVTTPTVLFADTQDGRIYTGAAAKARLVAGAEGRYMRSLKKYLGEPELLTTRITRYTYTLEDLIAHFLKGLRDGLEAKADAPVEAVNLGRPVRFNDDDPKLDAQGQQRLENAARQAGFRHVRFQYEPIAAALGYETRLDHEACVLVVDVGGGTTDYSIVRLGPDRARLPDRTADMLGYAGVYVGGDLFDSALITHAVTPALGRDATYRQMGKALPWPKYIFQSVASWAFFNRLYEGTTRRDVADMHATSSDPVATGRLQQLLDEHLYYEFSTAAEEAKKTLSHEQTHLLDMPFFRDPLRAPLTRADFDAWTTPLLTRLNTALAETLAQAGLREAQVDKVFLTGGTTLNPAVRALFSERFGADRLVWTDVFTGVGYGLVADARRVGYTA
jgi:hypothetical chaperone protein